MWWKRLSAFDRVDLVTALGFLAALFAGIRFFPRSWLWYWLIPWVLAWVRLNYVMTRRDQLMRERRLRPASGDRSQRRIGVLDRLKQSRRLPD